MGLFSTGILSWFSEAAMRRGSGSVAAMIIVCIVIGGAGCASVISQDLLQRADRTIRFQDLREQPGLYEGKIVLLGGMIVSTKNQPAGTLIEIVQKPLDFEKRPISGDTTFGRFLALYDGYLDPAIYAEGRDVTVAGPVIGLREQPLGEITYSYPLVRAQEIHLWAVRTEDRAYPYPPGGWWGYPPWWRYPYWGPWY